MVEWEGSVTTATMNVNVRRVRRNAQEEMKKEEKEKRQENVNCYLKFWMFQWVLSTFFCVSFVRVAQLQVASRYCLICSWFVNFHFLPLLLQSLIARFSVCKVLHSRDFGTSKATTTTMRGRSKLTPLVFLFRSRCCLFFCWISSLSKWNFSILFFLLVNSVEGERPSNKKKGNCEHPLMLISCWLSISDSQLHSL